MIYADASALVKLVLPEAESSGMVEFASRNALVTSAVGATELRRAVARFHPERMWVVEKALSEIAVFDVSREVLRVAAALSPTTLRTLDAIHLATALDIRETVEAIVAYDSRLSVAARDVGFTVLSPK